MRHETVHQSERGDPAALWDVEPIVNQRSRSAAALSLQRTYISIDIANAIVLWLSYQIMTMPFNGKELPSRDIAL